MNYFVGHFWVAVVLSLLSPTATATLATLHVWKQQTRANAIHLPNAPSTAAGGGFVVMLELQLSAQGPPAAVLSAFNVSTGVKVWQTPAMCSAVSIPVFLESVPDTKSLLVVLGCAEAIFLLDGSNGVVLQNMSAAALGLQVIAQRQPRQPGGTSGGIVLVRSSMFIVAVANATNLAQQGTVSISMSGAGIQLAAGPTFCELSIPLLSIHSGLGELGYIQVCATYASYVPQPYTVMFTPISSTAASWTYHGPSVAQVTTASFAYAASLSHVALAYFDGHFQGNFSVVSFGMGSVGLPMWNANLLSIPYNVFPFAFIQSIGEVIVIGLPQGGGVYLLDGTGAIQWRQQDIFAPLAVLPEYAINGTLAVVTAFVAYLLELNAGTVVATVPLEQPVQLPIFAVNVAVKSTIAPYNESGGVALSTGQMLMALAGGNAVQFFDVYGTLQQLMTIDLTSQVTAFPIIVPEFNPLTSPGESGLLISTSYGVQLTSLAAGWQLSEVLDVSPRGAYYLASFTSGSVSAVDRNGQTIWDVPAFTPPPSSVMVGAFGYRWMFAVEDNSVIATYDTYSGRLVRTFLIPSDCYSNASNPVPVILGISATSKFDVAYFSAGLPCLFSIASDLTLTTTSLPWTIFNIPIVDEANQMQYVYANHILYAVNSLTGSNQILASFDHEISDIIPSSWVFQSVAGAQYPLVFVFTPSGVSAVDVFRSPGINGANRVWAVSQYNIQSFKFFNASLYTVSQSGICKINPLDGNVLWCHGALQVEEATVVSSLTVSPLGELIFALDAHLYVIDSVDGTAPWSRANGYIPLPQGNCTQVTYAKSVYVVLALCSGVLYAIDGLSVKHPVLFFVDAAPADTVVFDHPTMTVISTATEVVSVYQMPLWVQNRVPAMPVPPPTNTVLPQTQAPGWTAAPSTPSPYLPSYPTPQQVAPPAATTFDPYSNDGELLASSVQGRGELQVLMYVSPTLSPQNTCVVSAFNITSTRQVWTAPFSPLTPDAPCGCGTVKLSTAGNVASLQTVALLCDGAIFVYRASAGVLLWNTTTNDCQHSGSPYTEMTQFLTTNGEFIVLAISSQSICGFAGLTGSVLFALSNTVGSPSQIQLLSQQALTLAALVGPQGLLVVSVPHANISNASVSYTYDAQSNVAHKCTGGPSIVLATSGNSADDMLSVPSFYAACATTIAAHQLAIFTVTATASSTVCTAQTSVLNPQIFEFVVDQSASLLTLSTSQDIVVLPLTGAPTHPRVIGVGGAIPSPYFISLAGSLLVALHFDSDINLVVGYNLTSADDNPLWVSNTSISVAESSPQPSRPIPAVLLDATTVLVAAGGIAAFNVGDGTELWVSHSNNAGMARQVTTWMDTGLVTHSGESAFGSLVTYFATSNSVGFVVANPVGATIEGQSGSTACFYASYFAFFASANDAIGVVATGTLQSTVPLMTNFAWLNSVDSAGMVIVVGDVALTIMAHSVSATDISTGAPLVTFFRSESCPSASGFAMQIPVTTMVVHSTVIFTDGICLYRIDVGVLQMDAVFISLADLADTSRWLLSQDNTTVFLQTASGLVVAAQVHPLSVLWMSDQLSALGFGNPSLISLPYAPSVSADKRQLIAYSTTHVASLSSATGDLQWLLEFNTTFSSIVATFSNDGNMIVFADDNILKVSLAVVLSPASSRLLWSKTLSLTSPIGWELITPVPNCRLIIAAAGRIVVATDSTSQIANVAWMFTSTQTTGSTDADSVFSSYALVGFPSAQLPPLWIALSGSGTVLLELDGGRVVYSYEHNVVSWASAGAFAISSGYPFEQCVVAQLHSIESPGPGVYIGLSPPEIPDDHKFTLPLPTSAQVLPEYGSSAPLFAWQYKNLKSSTLGDASGFPAVLGTTPVMLVLTFNGSSLDNLQAAMEAVQLTTGIVVDSLELWTNQCNARTLVQLSTAFSGALCVHLGGISGVKLYSLALISLSSSLAISSVVQMPFLFDDTVASVVTHTEDIGCLFTSQNSGGAIVCVSLVDSGVVTAAISCASLGDSFVERPHVIPGHQIMIVTCMGPTGYHVQAVFINNGTTLWSSNMGLVESQSTFYSSTNTFGSVLLQSGTNSNVTFIAYDLIAGPFASGTLARVSLPPTTPISGFTVKQLPSGDYFFTVVDQFSTPNVMLGVSSTSGQVEWSHRLSGTSAVVTVVALVTVPVEFNLVVASTASTHAFVEMLAFATGVLLYPEIMCTLHVPGTVVSVVQMQQPTEFYVTLDTSAVYVNVQPATVLVATLSVLPAATSFLSFPGTQQPKLVDLLGVDGTLTQLVLNSWYSTAIKSSHFSALSSIGPSPYIVSTIGTSTFLLNGSGNPLWGTHVQQGVAMSFSFDPVLFVLDSMQVLITSAYNATFFGFNATNGSLLYSGTLLMCRGQPPRSASVAIVPDFNSGYLYAVAGNPCLYKINPLTGLATVVGAASSSLTPLLMISPTCVLAVDSYGTVVCMDRSTSMSRWKYTTGFSKTVPTLTASGNLIVILFSSHLVCLMEASGEVLWENSVDVGGSMTIYDNQLFIVTSSSISCFAIGIASSSRVLWQLNHSASTHQPVAIPKPIVAVDGTLVVAIGNTILGVQTRTGKLKFTATTDMTCTSLRNAPPGLAGDRIHDIFVTDCGHYEVRSVASGESIVALGRVTSGCANDPMLFLPNDTLAFCNSNGELDVQHIPPFIATRAANVTRSSTDSPIVIVLPQGYVPQGVPTPAPTFADEDMFPNRGCLLNIDAMYPSLAHCLNATLTAAYRAGSAIQCLQTSVSLNGCVTSWRQHSQCVGAMVYLNTALSSLELSGALPCSDPSRCSDGEYGAICQVLSSVADGAKNAVLPSALLLQIPGQASSLPQFHVPDQPTTPAGGIGAAAIAGVAIALVVLVVGVVIVVLWRKRTQPIGRKHQNLNLLIQEDGDVAGEARELTSLVRKSRQSDYDAV